MKLQKIASLVLAIIMILSLGITAFADDTITPTGANGSITINGVGLDENDDPTAIYSIYKLLDLESYNVTSGAYSYKVNAAWTEFFKTEEALKYVAIDDAGYVTWIGGEDDDTVAKFAKDALSYAEEKGIAPVKSSENEGEFEVLPKAEGTTSRSGKFANLELGWYLVDSNVGALCGLTTTNPAASINAKNGAPSIDKQVLEDSTNQWVDNNTADIGQIVDFRVTINVHQGAQNYVLHDTMSKGLTFKGVSKITHIVPGASGNTETELILNKDYTVVTEPEVGAGLEDKCTFEVRFSKEFCDKLETNDKIIVSYHAMVNRYAIIAEDGNFNKAKLEYGDTFYTTEDSTFSKTYGIEIVKTDSQNTLIDGAQFKIYDAAEGGNEVEVVLMDDGVTYRRARADEEGVSIVVKNGIVKVVGFDNGTYYLEETVAPAGYNKLTARQRFIISDNNLYATFNGEVFSTGSGVHVVNKTGSMLPETGGMGTTLFYVAGGLLVGGAVVALVSKKRMSTK